ncbi:MAG: hypothetical protein AB1656_14805 [Candidatus Omnitrophota bacterium]
MTRIEAYRDLQKKVRRAHRRHCYHSLYSSLVQALFYALIGACLAAAVLALLPKEIDRLPIALAIAALCLPAALYLYYRRRGNVMQTALLADRHLRLKEKISSALELGTDAGRFPGDADWHDALLFDALGEAHRLDLKKAFPWKNPREFHWLWAPLLGLILTVFVLPQWDFITGGGKAQAKAMDKQEIEKELQNLFNRQLVLEKRAKEKEMKNVAEIAKEIKELETDLLKGKIEKRDALAKLSSLQEEWEKQREELKENQPSLNPAAPMQQKLTSELAKDLESSEYEKAAQKLQELQKKMKMGAMNEGESDRLSNELNQLAANLSADSPLAKALKNAAAKMKAGDQKSSLQSLQLAEADLKDLQDALEQMQLLDQALADLKNSKFALAGKFGKCSPNICNASGCGLCAGCNGAGCSMCNGTGLGGVQGKGGWKAGPTDKMGNSGMRGAGIGRGGQAPFQDTDTGFQQAMAKSPFNPGPILGTISVDGESLNNQSTVLVNEALFEYKQAAEDALTKEKIPIPYQFQVRAYFNTLHAEDLERPAAPSGESG